jgi:sarcosine oxidase, subunit alpha
MPRLADPRFAPDCTIDLDGRPIPARAGESVAVALLAAGIALVGRSGKYHRPRGAFCLAGSCHTCLARVGGLPNRRTCRVPCVPGLSVESQNAVPTARRDVLAGLDLVYAGGLDHHHLMTWSDLANRAAVAFSRRLAGSGALAGGASPLGAPAPEERFDALVIGAGPAGLGAAEALAAAGERVLLAESDALPGGRLRCALGLPGDPPLIWAGEVARAVAAAGGEVACGLTALGIWRDGGSPLVALRVEAAPARLRLVRALRLVVASGTSASPPCFERNDLPGVLAGRGLLRALAEDGLVPGARALVAGAGAEAEAVAARLAGAGVEVRGAEAVTAAHGGQRVRAASLTGGARLACDAIVFAGPRVPASELARQAGAAVELDAASGGWRVRADRGGRTGVRGLLAAGEVTGGMSAAEAASGGRRAGEAAHADR